MLPNGVQGDRAVVFAPPQSVNGLDSHTHTVQFYEADEVLLDGLSEVFGSALDAGHAGIVIATKAHRDGLAARLEATGLDVAHAAGQGRYIALDAAETLAEFMSDGWPDAARLTDLMGGLVARVASPASGARPRLVMFGEAVALLCADGKHEAAIHLEQLWNDLAQTHSFTVHCAYPMSSFRREEDGESLEKICAAHSHVTPAESYTSLTNDAERLRSIARLQQKAHALESEIAERKRVERALRERNQELRVAVTARDEFLSVAAHELKTPVTSLRSFAQLLLRDARRKRVIAPDRLERALDVIERQTGKLNQLVTRLLDTAQVEAGTLRIEPVETDLVSLIHSVLAHHHGDADHPLSFDGPERLDAVVDPLRFEQVITNLLDNAVKFSPQGGVVTVELRHDEAGGIRLCVTDQGVGIPPDQREEVFDRFHQAHGKRHLSGLGLGLYVTREIIELHGGSMRIEEPEHRGSRLVLTLPPAADDVQTDSAA